MRAWPILLIVAALGAVAFAGGASGAPRQPRYTSNATYACLVRLPHAVVGVPPVSPPRLAMFVSRIPHSAFSTAGVRQRRHVQIGVWFGKRSTGIILSFFRSARDARVSLKSLEWLDGGGRLLRNVAVTRDQDRQPARRLRRLVTGCLRPGHATAKPQPAPPATLATFAGQWGGHDRGLKISAAGVGDEEVLSSCCVREYGMTFQILSVKGTVTRAFAKYSVTTFTQYDKAVPPLNPGDVGTLRIRNGIITNTLTGTFFCSGPAWGISGACGA